MPFLQMPLLLSTIASAFAFLTSALVLEMLLRGSKPPVHGARRSEPCRQTCAGLSALACFLFIPPGSLAPACNAPWGAAAWLALFFGSTLCGARAGAESPDDSGRYKKDVAAAITVGGVIALLAWTAWRRGVPGSPLNFGTYAAMPLWDILDPCGIAGFLLLFAGLVLIRPGAAADAPGFGPGMRRLVWCACIAAVFAPNPMAGRDATALLTVAGDYIFFWAATVLLFRLPLPERWSRPAAPGALCCLAGAVLLLVSL